MSFRDEIAALPREEIIELIKDQDQDLWTNLRRIEWVFEHKLSHLNWGDGTPVIRSPLTNKDLALIVDEPFEESQQLTDLGFDIEQQKQIYIAKDPVLWSKHFLGVYPRAYQVLMLRYDNNRKVLRAGRRLGKSYTMAIFLLHYCFTHQDAPCLVVTPMKSQAEVLFKAIKKLVAKSEIVKNTIVRQVSSPQYELGFSTGSTIKFFTSGMRCLTPDHDVLSIDGWKPISDIVQSETILTWENGEYKWGDVSDTHEYDYSGDLVAHEGKQISFRATPNHKFIAKTRFPTSQWRDVRADQLKDYYLPTGAIPTLPMRFGFSADELELWGWWLAEGAGFIGKMVRISQFKEYGRKRLVELAESMGLHYTTPKGEIRIQWEPPIYSGTNCYNKFIPRELFDEAGRSNLLEGLLGGDGWVRTKGWEYSSSSYQLANDVQELAVRMGLRANIREKIIRYSPVAGGPPNRHWIVSGYDYKTSLLNEENLRRESYSGKVHCVTVPSGYFVVRHNGLVHVTGNSGGKADVVRGQEAQVIVLDELDLMHNDDLESIYAMLQNTDEAQGEKYLIGASTPTGRKETFWKWANSPRFKEFWFPSYCNPLFTKDVEQEFRDQYTEMGYRHEIEADWGEDEEGVYPRRFVDLAFKDPGWTYDLYDQKGNSFYVMGIDWNSVTAGSTIVVLEVCEDNYPDPRFAGKTRLFYREEIDRGEYTLTRAVERTIELNKILQPRHIYVDQGYGALAVELLHKHGVDHPESQLKKRVVDISFSSTLEMRDPASKQIVKKEMKPFMVNCLVQMLEAEQIIFPVEDEKRFRESKSLYMQLISYVVQRSSHLGRAVFEMTEGVEDHAHDALILACLAITKNYSDLMRLRLARKGMVISNEPFLPIFELSDIDGVREAEEEVAAEIWGSVGAAPVKQRRAMTVSMNRKNVSRPITRKVF